MQFQTEITPQYRDADADGLIGLRGFLSYSQDAATWHMHGFGLGNDEMIDRFGIAWMYTKCHISIFEKTGYSGSLLAETGMTKTTRATVDRDFRLTQNGRLLALSRLESCLYKFDENRLCRLEEVDFPDTVLDTPFDNVACVRLPRDVDDMKKIYSYRILYTDLDKSMHMNNLYYTNLFLNAFEPDFHAAHFLKSYDINYVSQGFYGSEIDVLMRRTGDTYDLAATDNVGKIIALARIVFVNN